MNKNVCFKPCYKWNTFNTLPIHNGCTWFIRVLNLVISGIPSIHGIHKYKKSWKHSFKPCYKWNTFNTKKIMLDILK